MKAAEYKHAIVMENIKNSHAETLKKLEAGKQPTQHELLKLEVDALKAGFVMKRTANGIEFIPIGKVNGSVPSAGGSASNLNSWTP